MKYTRIYSKQAQKNVKNKYAHTVNLPRTNFPAKLTSDKRIENDKYIFSASKFNELYSWQRENLSGPEFILHDGPPYANGKPHMGHAVNKILKDIITRHCVIKGQRVHYVPGWDCHGLPIELKALTSADTKEKTVLEIREKARQFARQTIDHQLNIFKEWGVMANWNSNIYKTYNSSYIINQLKLFYEMYEKGFIYRDFKPVYWSPSSRTALAEAELEYNQHHTSISVYLKLKLFLPNSLKSKLPDANSELYALIWTTTPWSLPANQAVCYNENLSYSIVKTKDGNNDFLLLATDCIKNLSEMNIRIQEICSFDGNILQDVTYSHPLKPNETLPFYSGSHVNSAKGTGLVHTAPAHGPDDFLIAMNKNIPIKCLVDDNGCYTEEAGCQLKGLPVLSDGNKAVINLIENKILFKHTYVHSYPYDWRTKKPVILKASQQWFINTNRLKKEAIKQLENVHMLPENSSYINKKTLIDMINNRPYWCISRQRVWGVPIPVIYEKTTGKHIITEALTKHFCDLITTYGPDCWWTLPVVELLPQKMLDLLNLNIDNVELGKDIFDIWFDSGVSWSSILGNDKIADLYLEGIDQLTGWFQSSLLTSVALRGSSPFKNLFVHGFAVDEKGRKMSKSVGNVIDPNEIISGKIIKSSCGIDVLRWWVASHSMLDSKITVGQNVLETSADEIHKIRNTMRFLLGNLNDFEPQKQNENELDFHIVDGYLLHLLWNYNQEVCEIYDKYHFNKLCRLIIHFITNSISGFYCHVIKNRLYCEPVNSSKRRAAQFVVYQILQVLNRSIAPIVPHLAEEIQMHNPCNKGKELIFHSKDIINDKWHQPEIEPIMELIFDLKQQLHKKVKDANTNSFNVTINAKGDSYQFLKLFQPTEQSSESQLVEILQVAEVQLINDNTLSQMEDFSINIRKCELNICERCRKYMSQEIGVLCVTCTKQVNFGAIVEQ